MNANTNKLFRFIVNFVYDELNTQFINNNGNCNSSTLQLINFNGNAENTVIHGK